MMENMISVVVITYNQEVTISRTLDSILMQQCHVPFEIVIGEDCSTDNTRAICQSYAEKHPDIIRLFCNEQNKGIVKQIYEQMPEPKVVVAVGICACSGGIFKDCYNVMGGVDQVIPVDAYVPGCAARPEAIIDAVVKGLGVLQAKRDAMVKAVDAPAEEVAEAAAEEVATEEKKAGAVPPIFTMAEIKVNTMDFLKK